MTSILRVRYLMCFTTATMVLSGCGALQSPLELTWDKGEAPRYDDPIAWFSLPSRSDTSDELPKKIPSTASPARWDSIDVDVFFVHPTMYFRGDHWNAHLDNDQVNRDTEHMPMRAQASAFNIGGRMYAPRYRQAHIGVFTWQDSTSWAALELAYEDVRASFVHYLEHWNDGRDIILAGHSQGSWHLRWLLQEFFDGKPLQDQLVAAYGPGFDWYATDFDHIPFCEEPNQTGCACSWMSYGAGFFPKWLDTKSAPPMCVNPITWTLGSASSALQDHEGVVLSQMRFAFPHSIRANIERGVLQIEQPQVRFGRWLQRENWHVGDINLFWININKNARLRCENHR